MYTKTKMHTQRLIKKEECCGTCASFKYEDSEGYGLCRGKTKTKCGNVCHLYKKRKFKQQK